MLGDTLERQLFFLSCAFLFVFVVMHACTYTPMSLLVILPFVSVDVVRVQQQVELDRLKQFQSMKIRLFTVQWRRIERLVRTIRFSSVH
jgi:hypothetical protein